MNKLLVIGRISNDVETTYSGAKDPVARSVFNFAIPAMSMKKDKDGNYPCDFIRCVSFGKIAENIEKYCEKGSKLLLEGRIKNNNYEKDGTMVYSTEVLVDSIEFLDIKKKETTKK